MRLCRFDADRLGVLRGDKVIDVTSALESIPAVRWPFDPGDLLIANLDRLRGTLEYLSNTETTSRHLVDCALKSPIAKPSKNIGATKNYYDADSDGEPALSTLSRDGLFLKASSSVIGPSEGVELTL